MNIRKHGGVYFWNAGPIGGSIHVKRAILADRQRAAMIGANTSAGLIGMFVAAAGIAALLAFTDRAPAAAATYDLVLYQGAESDIVDYDLSASDCRGFALERIMAGDTVACEPSL